ncbi:MAG: hypothetical protein OCD01_09205 [Fibrobacterales bacterium]
MIENSMLVLFGALGDLTHKKLFPALNSFFVQQKLPQNFHYSDLKNTYILVVYEKIIDPIIQYVRE